LAHPSTKDVRGPGRVQGEIQAPGRWVGANVARKDAHRFVAGAVDYAADLIRPGTLYVSLLRSQHAHAAIRGIDAVGCFPQMGSPIALFLSTGTFSLLALMPKDDFVSWGWRIPFVGSAVLIVIGLIFRLKLLESPSFVEAAARGQIVAAPLKSVLKNDLKRVLIGGGVVLCTTVAFYVQAIFVVSYATQTVGAPRQVVLNAVLIGSFFELLMLPAFAVLADRIGLKPVAFFGALWTAAFSFPFFKFIDAGTPFSIGLGITLAMVGISALFAVLPAYTSRLFDTQVRFTGISLSYGIASGLIGGLTPLLASSLFIWAQSSWPIALYLVGIGTISMIAVLVSPALGKEATPATAAMDAAIFPGQASRT